MRLGYLCKYVPVEILENMGAEMVRITPDVTGFERADRLMHPNMCSFIKAVLEEYADGAYDGIVLTNCCDSTRRLYDCIREEFPDRFSHMLDVPRLVSSRSCSLFAGGVRALMERIEEEGGRPLDEPMLRSSLEEQAEQEKKTLQDGQKIRIAVMGARISESVRIMIDEYDVEVADDMTCTEIERRYEIPTEGDLVECYSEALMKQFPCMRMADTGDRFRRVKKEEAQIDGILYHTMKFCDMYSYEFASLSRESRLPVLKIETDSTSQAAGQLRTRLEAFFESIVQAKGLPAESIRKKLRSGVPAESEGSTSEMLFRRKKAVPSVRKKNDGPAGGGDIRVIGVDSGSTSTNAVLMGGEKQILASVVIRTGARSIESAEEACRQVAEKGGIRQEDVNLLVSTGYGRVNIDFADREITEISCHGKGANYFNPEVRTILDIGGQDSKAIRIDGEGNVLDFAMNDKCAAGTGRFLEMMASTLSVGLDELGPLSLDWQEDIDISSMCSVFAESEVISLIADNREKADIAHGVHKSIAGRAVSLMKRVGLEEGFMMTGGVAKNQGAVREIEKRVGHRLYICEEPEIVGAVGAALFGINELMGR
ncbi:MAG: 2-hydroxyacyl-CoA dehydratase [Firmicutes bacterium]|nr:2-hydroxyacyl-CoA dehydratase [Bacillota bacterium]